jgi:carboxyl-terminal processing protease
VDLRDNPGGQVEEAACILNLFVDKGQKLFETRYLDLTRKVDVYTAEQNALFRGPMAVLINSGSASASEIIAGSLKDLGRATLVGEKTFGKGTFQDGRLWGSHEKIAIFETEGMYYFPSGWSPQLVGIHPDIAVNFGGKILYREDELFFNPIIPKDLWTGPQSLAWLNQVQCPSLMENWQDASSAILNYDPQVTKAQEWLNCKGKVGINL